MDVKTKSLPSIDIIYRRGGLDLKDRVRSGRDLSSLKERSLVGVPPPSLDSCHTRGDISTEGVSRDQGVSLYVTCPVLLTQQYLYLRDFRP